MNSDQINLLQDLAASRVQEVLLAMGVEFQTEHHFLTGPCPVHDGDNPRGWFWAFRTQSWRCNTNGCHTTTVTGPSSSLFGLVRGVMSMKTNRQWSFAESVQFVQQALGISEIPDTPVSAEERLIAKTILESRQRLREEAVGQSYPLADFIELMDPDQWYYPQRGYREETLRRYHVSYCGNRHKPFYQRAYFPILDSSGIYIVGWSARSIWEKCRSCEQYHDPCMVVCPESKPRYAKWRHSYGFRAERYLYNLWHAARHINKTQTAILVEGPGDVWAMEEAGIRNSVAIMGLNVSDYQNRLLQKAGALTLVLLCDNDESGQAGAKRLSEGLSLFFRVHIFSLHGGKDVGSMDRQAIREELSSVINLES